jgi:hypothetical protein
VISTQRSQRTQRKSEDKKKRKEKERWGLHGLLDYMDRSIYKFPNPCNPPLAFVSSSPLSFLRALRALCDELLFFLPPTEDEP